VVALYFFVGTVRLPSVALFWRLLVVAIVMILARYMGEVGFMHATLAFLIGIAGWLYILGECYFGQMGEIVAKSNEQRLQRGYFWLRLIVTIGWAIYPLGSFISSFGGGVDAGSLAVAYNLSDFINRIAFGLAFLAVAMQPGEPAK
jgi:bacteriorhodopsin